MRATVSPEPVPSPRGWLRLALFGSFVYLAAQLMDLYLAAASRATGMAQATLTSWLPVAAGAGLLLLLAGLIAAFWRVNRVAGHTGAGVAGLVTGTLGVLLLTGLEVVVLAANLGLSSAVLASLENDATLATSVGTFLAFAGLGALGLGLARAIWVAPPVAASRQPAHETSESGSSGYRSY